MLSELAAIAERLFPFDPAGRAVEPGLLSEAIAQNIAARWAIRWVEPPQAVPQDPNDEPVDVLLERLRATQPPPFTLKRRAAKLKGSTP